MREPESAPAVPLPWQYFLRRGLLLRGLRDRFFPMARETYKKRQKELARQQQQRDEAAHRQQRNLERKKDLPQLQGEALVRAELRLELRAQDNGALLCP